MIYNDMFLINYNSNDYQPVAESPCQMLVSALTVLLPLFVSFHLWKLLGELSPLLLMVLLNLKSQSYPRILGIRKLSFTVTDLPFP